MQTSRGTQSAKNCNVVPWCARGHAGTFSQRKTASPRLMPCVEGLVCAVGQKNHSNHQHQHHHHLHRCHSSHHHHQHQQHHFVVSLACAASGPKQVNRCGAGASGNLIRPGRPMLVWSVVKVKPCHQRRRTNGDGFNQRTMNFCGWLKVFKRKGKQVTAGDEDGRSNAADLPVAVAQQEDRKSSGKRANGRFGWGRKIKSGAKQQLPPAAEVEELPKEQEPALLEPETGSGASNGIEEKKDKNEEERKSAEKTDEGNPRNKTALKPGHSLMDWIRLGNSGADLTGTGGRTQPVSHAELAKHDRKEDAWMAIRGKVYNVTRYMDFHPGGADELMRGVGKDATKLFDEVHAWVNYESLLAKCYIGPLRNVVTVNLTSDTTKNPNSKLPPPPPSFLAATKTPPASPNLSVAGASTMTTTTAATTSTLPDGKEPDRALPASCSTTSIISSGSDDDSLKVSIPIVPRFDWIQKTTDLTLIFYTRSLANPGMLVECDDDRSGVSVSILLEASVQHRYRFRLSNSIQWPCTVRNSLESGKIELQFSKEVPALWTAFGDMQHERKENCEMQLSEYDVATRLEITHDSCALLLQAKSNRLLQITPIGYHVSVSASIDGEYVSRSYTPVPARSVGTDCPGTCVPLLVKSYTDGSLSKHLTRPVPLATSLQVSQPSGNFVLSKLRYHNRFALLAAGSGLTPMLALLSYLLERNGNRIEHVSLLYFNKTEADIWCREMLENLCKKDKRLTVRHFLSEADPQDAGISERDSADGGGDGEHGTGSSFSRGRISLEIVRQLTTPGSPSYATYCCVCGPKPFNELCLQYFQQTEHNPKHLHSFQG